jgi:hypothetical protein
MRYLPMARRPFPERIQEARRAALRNRLLSTGMLPDRLDHLWADWEAHASILGITPQSAAYWQSATEWLLQRA